MDQIVGYDKKEFKQEIEKIYHKLSDLTGYLAMISQQLDGKRDNLNSDYIKETVMKNVNRIVEILNEFGTNPEKLAAFNLDERIKGLEKLAKEDLY